MAEPAAFLRVGCGAEEGTQVSSLMYYPGHVDTRMNTYTDTREVELVSIPRVRGGRGTAWRRRKSGLKYLACAFWAACLCPLNMPC